MKNFVRFCVFCASISILDLHAFAQNSSNGGNGSSGGASSGQWPGKFPYPPEFPVSGDCVDFGGVGDESGPFIAVYTSYSTGNMVAGAFTVTDKLYYEYQEYTTSAGILVRRKLRTTWDDFPRRPNLRQTTRTGFTEFKKSENTADGSFESIRTTYHDWDYNPTPGGPIVSADNTRYCCRILSKTQTTTTQDCLSERTRVYNSRYPLLFPRNEKINVVFTDSSDSWALVRKYKSMFGEKVVEDAGLWPNSGGEQGSSAVAEFEILPEIALYHPYGKEVLTMESAFQYEIFLWNESEPWNIEPF